MAQSVASHPSTQSDSVEQPLEQQVVTPSPQPSSAGESCEKHQQALAEIDEALQRLADSLAAGQSEQLKAYLRCCARFHRYSLNNQVLIYLATAGRARFVAGFHAWRKFGRFVRKGEKGIVILAPVTRIVGHAETVQADGNVTRDPVRRMIGVRATHVWADYQTEGDELPEFATVRGYAGIYDERIDQLIRSEGVILRYVTNLGGALGITNGKEIHILDSLTGAERFTTKVHELAHAMMHYGDRRSTTDRRIRETEAEAVSFVVAQAIGVDTVRFSSDYLSLYGANVETLRDSLEHVRRCAASILERLMNHVNEEDPA